MYNSTLRGTPGVSQCRPSSMASAAKMSLKKVNRPFYRYGGHIELTRFKEYMGCPGSMSTIRYGAQYLRALMGKKDRRVVFGCNNERLFPKKYTVKFSFCPKSARKY